MRCASCGRRKYADNELEELAEALIDQIRRYDPGLWWVKIKERTDESVKILHKQSEERFFEERPEPYWRYSIRRRRNGSLIIRVAYIEGGSIQRRSTVEVPDNWNAGDVWEDVNMETGLILSDLYTEDRNRGRGDYFY